MDGVRSIDEVSERSVSPARAEARPIYLDHHATTPVDPRVADVVLCAMTSTYGNANSVDHAFGEAANALISTASEALAWLVGSSAEDVHFTSGSTEAIRLALAHASTRQRQSSLRVALTSVEHRAVIGAVMAASRSGNVEPLWIDVDEKGSVSLDSLRAALRAGVDLVCLIAANNEVGTINPVKDIVAHVHGYGAAILVDATQAAGRVPLSARDWDIEYLVVSAHKLYGPKGVGALVSPIPNLRSQISDHLCAYEGTPNVPGIAGFGEACRLRLSEMAADEARIAALRDRLQAELTASIPGLVVNGHPSRRLSGNLHVSVPGIPNEAVMARLRNKVAISTGAACASGAHTSSHVLQAMGLSEELQDGALRIGIGKFNTAEEIGRAAREIAAAVMAVRTVLSGSSR